MLVRFPQKIFMEKKSPGKYARILKVIQPTKDGMPSIVYEVFDGFSGQRICEDSARLEDFERYVKAGELYWQG